MTHNTIIMLIEQYTHLSFLVSSSLNSFIRCNSAFFCFSKSDTSFFKASMPCTIYVKRYKQTYNRTTTCMQENQTE